MKKRGKQSQAKAKKSTTTKKKKTITRRKLTRKEKVASVIVERIIDSMESLDLDDKLLLLYHSFRVDPSKITPQDEIALLDDIKYELSELEGEELMYELKRCYDIFTKRQLRYLFSDLRVQNINKRLM